MEKEVKKVPELRFPGVDGGWKQCRLDNLFSIFNGYAFSSDDSQESGCRWVKIADVGINIMKEKNLSYLPYNFRDKHQKFVLKATDYVVALTRPILGGKLKIAKVGQKFDGALLNQRVGKLVSENQCEYVYHFLQRSRVINIIENRIAGTDPPNLSPSEVGSLKTYVPGLPEQQKIASFLSAVDKKIEQLTRKKELLEQYKKGVMQKIFSKEIRFKPAQSEVEGDDNGQNYPDWEEKRFGDIFNRITTKNNENNQNVLTISAQLGLINQQEFFNKSVSASDVSGYYLLKKGDFAYNKSYSKGYPMGAIKRLRRYEKGVVSTLYICFAIKGDDSPEYFEEFLDFGGINRELHKIAQEGARNHGLLNMSVVEFFNDVVITTPSILEQNKISKFLRSLSKRIHSAKKKLEQTQKFKKGLLQKMFV